MRQHRSCLRLMLQRLILTFIVVSSSIISNVTAGIPPVSNSLTVGITSTAVTRYARVVKCCTLIGYIQSRQMDDTSPPKGAWLESCDPFQF